MHRAIALAVCGLATTASAQSPALTPEQFLPGDSAVLRAAGAQDRADACLGGGAVLAVWEDDRTRLSSILTPDGNGTDVYGLRIDATGTRLDPVPIPIAQSLSDQRLPRVAWNGTEWLVTFMGRVPTASFYTDAIQAVRVSAQGVVLDADPITVETIATSGNGELFGVASDGADFLVAWKDWTGSSWQVRGKRVSSQGALVDAAPVALQSNVASQPYNGAVTFAQDEYAIAWQQWSAAGQDDVYLRRTSKALAAIGGVVKVSNSPMYDVRPRIATDGAGFLLAWERYDTCCVCGGGRVVAARVTHAGQVQDVNGIEIAGGCPTTIGREPSAAWDGTNWQVAWTAEGAPDLHVRVSRISPAGALLDAAGILVDPAPSRQDQPAIAAAPSGGTFVAYADWSAGGDFPTDVFLARVSAAGQSSGGECVSLGLPSQTSPAAVDHGAGSTIAFLSMVSGAQRVLVQRVAADGSALDLQPVEVAPFGPNVRSPAIAWNGDVYLVAWQDLVGTKPAILARRFGPSLFPLDAAPIVVMDGSSPDVAALDGAFLAVAVNAPANPQFRFPYSRRIDAATGALLDAAPHQLGQYFAGNIEVARIGPRWLATWQRNFSHDDAHAEIMAAFVDADGGSPGEFTVAGGYLYRSLPTVASDDANALIAFQNDTVSTLKADVLARMVSLGGALSPIFAVSDAPNPQSRPAAAFDGAQYVVEFEDMRNIPVFFDTRTDLYAARVSAGGVLLDPSGFAVATDPLPEVHAAASGRAGSAVLLGAAYLGDGEHDAYRIFARATDAPCPGELLAYGDGCDGAGGVPPTLALSGCPVAGGVVELRIAGGAPSAAAVLAFGLGTGSLPIGPGCALDIAPLSPLFLAFALGQDGTFAVSAPLPSGTTGVFATMQALVADPATFSHLAATNAASMQVP